MILVVPLAGISTAGLLFCFRLLLRSNFALSALVILLFDDEDEEGSLLLSELSLVPGVVSVWLSFAIVVVVVVVGGTDDEEEEED